MSALVRRPPTTVLAHRSLDAKSLVAALDERQGAAFAAVRQLAQEAGTPVYLVGGPVRDALLGVPVLDLDFSVVGDALGLALRLQSRLGGRLDRFPTFGTASLSAEGLRVDLVTARRESYGRPGVLPQVMPGSIDDDLARRDFSINAMALLLNAPKGRLLDPLGGLADLEAGVVRSLHRQSFVDDPTRMMRAVRYEQRFGFSVDKATLDAISSAVAAGHMGAVSGDRWRRELERMLEETDPVAPLLRASRLGLLSGLHPAFDRLRMDDQGGLRRLDVLRKAGGGLEPEHCVAALFSPLSAPEAEAVIRRLNLTGRRAALARDTIALKQSEPEIRRKSGIPSELVRFLDDREPEAVSAWAELTLDEAVACALRRYSTELRFVRPEVSGLMLRELGYVPGPAVGETLGRLRDARLEGAVKSREEEIALARELLERACLNPPSEGEGGKG